MWETHEDGNSGGDAGADLDLDLEEAQGTNRRSGESEGADSEDQQEAREQREEI